jgi:hypothetical protein
LFVFEHFINDDAENERKRDGMNKGEQQIPTEREKREKIVLPMKNPFRLLLSISSTMTGTPI